MTSVPHLLPLLVNEATKEPYLQLPFPHSNIIITAPRQDDQEIATITSILNDPRVCSTLIGPPFPYEEHHAREWVKMTSEESDRILKQLEAHPGQPADGCPVRVLREVLENGEDIYIGDVKIAPSEFNEISQVEERLRLCRENTNRLPGDPEKIYEFGDYLAASHHGCGIMSSAIKTLLNQWIKPRMGVKKMVVTTFEGNNASVRVFEKAGFVLEDTLLEYKTLPESKGEKKIGMHVLRWSQD